QRPPVPLRSMGRRGRRGGGGAGGRRGGRSVVGRGATPRRLRRAGRRRRRGHPDRGATVTRRAPAVGLASAMAVLVVAGRALPVPPSGALGPWLAEVGPVVATATALRLVALGAAGLLATVAGVGLLAGALGALRLAAALDRAMPAPLRRALATAAGVGTAGTVLLGAGFGPSPSAASSGAGPVATASLVPVPSATLRAIDPPPSAGEPA